ncbi:MAG: chemotaxis protein CheW [Gammaproteobacteria bacterium]|nr:MAG: chemotaxis protein CheW [Gammaproteobacteria bacterium]
MSRKQVQPLEILHQMEQDVLSAEMSLPEEIVVAEQWVGLSYRVGKLQFVTAMDQISEVVPSAPFTVVPRSQSWLRGIANVRGQLLTVVDLQDFLCMGPVNVDQYSRLIVINNALLSCCLLVSRLQGLRHFDPVGDSCNTGDLGDQLAGFVTGALGREKEKWLVFDTDRLVDKRGFLNAAA